MYTVGATEVKLAQCLPETVKRKIAEFESKRWAATTTDREIQALWNSFLNELSSSAKKQVFTEKEMLVLSSYITTKDSLSLMARLDELSPDMLRRFLMLVEWYANSGQGTGLSVAAFQFVERVNTTYRMYMLPIVFSEDRLNKAIEVVKAM